MSVMSQLRRSVFGVPPNPMHDERAYERKWRKRRFWKKERDSRGAIHARAAAIFSREMDKKRERNGN